MTIKRGFQVFDDNDLPLSGMCTASTIVPTAKRIATERQSLVYYYGDNGRWVVEPDPVVGCPATICYYTDRVACTVVAVSPSGRKITVQEDKAIRTDDNGMSECQSYTYERNQEGLTHVFYKRGDGYETDGKRLALGVRRSYHDYSF